MSDAGDRFIEEFGDELLTNLKLDDADWIHNQYLEEEDSEEVFLFVDVHSKGGIYKLKLDTGPLFSKYWDTEDMPRFINEFLRLENEDVVLERLKTADIIK